MKTLYIARHAKTEVQQQGQLDFNRALAPRATQDIATITSLLKHHKIGVDAIVCSPALRAISTAKLLATKLDFEISKIEQNSLIYNASLPTLLSIIWKLDDRNNHVFFVGHNPGLTLLSNFLSLPPIAHIPTSGIVGIEFNVKKWGMISAEKSTQRFFIYPKLEV